MATQNEIDELRRKAGLLALDNTYGDDVYLGLLIDAMGAVDPAVADIWEQKASSVASMVNVSESGSSRSLGDIHKNYIRMAEHYRATETPAEAATGNYARTRPVVREGGF